jgi:PAS domain S-box-containing protein
MVANQALDKTSRGDQEEDVSGMSNQPDTAKVESSIAADQVTSNMIDLEPDLNRIQGKFSPGYNLFIIISGIAVAEIIAMIVVYFYRTLPYYLQVALDAALMTVIIFPLIYFLSTKPMLQHLQHRVRTENILEARLQIIQYARIHSYNELLQATLDEIEILTGSTSSCIQLFDADQKTPDFTVWSTRTLNNQQSSTGSPRYGVDPTGIRAECRSRGQAVIHNRLNRVSKGSPKSEVHHPITREAAIPIFRNEKIAAILWLADKPKAYKAEDIELVTTVADFAWDIVKHKQAGDALRESEEKFRTLVDWTYDWELWLDPGGTIVYNSPSCERVTGYQPREFITLPDLMIRMIHPEDRLLYEEHQQLLHDETADMAKMEYRIITRGGRERWIEHVCRPVYGSDNRFLGRRISNRDITDRKRAEKDIFESNRKERLLIQTIHTMQLDIARDLHDTIGQNISFLRMKLDHLAGKKTRKQTKMQLELQSMAAAANESYDLMRGTLAILQSTNSSDLYRLFTRYAEQIEERSTFKVECVSRGEPKPLTAPRMRQFFYVFREIMNNIEKHASAQHVTLDMTWDPDGIKLVISDDGRGFDLQQVPFGSHYGLKFMKERIELLNGSMAIHSIPGSGTKVEVHIPYEQSYQSGAV